MNIYKKYKQICEDLNPQYAYHCTNVKPEIIMRQGFKSGKGGYTQENMFQDLYDEYYPEIPVFVTDEENIWTPDAKYVLKLDISGLKLYPDFGTLPDYGAYFDFDSGEWFYWEHEEDIPNGKFKKFVLEKFPSLEMPVSDFTGENSFKYLGSAVVSGKKLNKRIVDVRRNI